VRTIEGIKWSTGLAAWLMVGFLSACGGQNGSKEPLAEEQENIVQDSVSEPVMLFDTLEHDFGTIIEGEMVVCYFDYKNIGEGDLLIKSVTATCGCTTPDWNKAPLKSGESDRLKVVFNSSGRSGSQLKTVSVESNALTPLVKLSIRANVIKRK